MMTMAELAKEIGFLTTEHLQTVVKRLVEVQSRSSSTNTVDEAFLTYGLSVEVLRFFLGNSWTNKNVFSFASDLSSQQRKGRNFLKTTSINENEQFLHQQRVLMLAETVFNLQNFQGFKERIRLINNDDLEAALGEMECAALLVKQELKFRFIIPTGVKRQDYDCEVNTPKNRLICCEIKSKSENSELNNTTLINTFKDAKKQLPKDQPGIILVKIPEKWIIQSNLQKIIEATIERIYRQSQRIVAILFLWEEWGEFTEGRWCVCKFKSYLNKKSNFYEDDVEDLIKSLGQMNNNSWIGFQIFVKKFMKN